MDGRRSLAAAAILRLGGAQRQQHAHQQKGDCQQNRQVTKRYRVHLANLPTVGPPKRRVGDGPDTYRSARVKSRVGTELASPEAACV